MKEKDWDKNKMLFDNEFSFEMNINKNFIYPKSNYFHKSTKELIHQNIFSNYEGDTYSEIYLLHSQILTLQSEDWTKLYSQFVYENKRNKRKYFHFTKRVNFWKIAFIFILFFSILSILFLYLLPRSNSLFLIPPFILSFISLFFLITWFYLFGGKIYGVHIVLFNWDNYGFNWEDGYIEYEKCKYEYLNKIKLSPQRINEIENNVQNKLYITWDGEEENEIIKDKEITKQNSHIINPNLNYEDEIYKKVKWLQKDFLISKYLLVFSIILVVIDFILLFLCLGGK